MLTGKNNSPTGGTYGVSNIGTVEPHSLVSDAVQIGCFVPVGSVGGNCLIGIIIGENEQDIGSLGRNKRADQKDGEDEN